MSAPPGSLWSWRVARLRDAFDASFAAPLPEPRAAERVLLLRVGATASAVALEDCSQVAPAGHVTSMPSAIGSFRGLATIDGAILPVYDLAAQLNIDAAGVRPASLLVSSGRQRVAFLVGAVEGYAELDAGVPPHEGGLTMITIAGMARRWISLAAVVAAIDQELQHVNRSRSER